MANPYAQPLDLATLLVEVAGSTFAFNNKIKGPAIKALWDSLCAFIATTLKAQKGVLLPNLGNFRVGPVVGESRKKIRPIFALLEGRYGGVSQERARYIIGGRAPIVQPSYSLLSTQSGIHRGATQRVIAELLQRLGIHILTGRPLRVEFPGVGIMLTNRAGRFEFIFDSLLMEYFELEHAAVIKEMDPGPVPKDKDLVKALHPTHIANPPYLLSPRSASAATGVAGPLPPTPPPRPMSPYSAMADPAARPLRPSSAHHQPFQGDLLRLYKLCKQADRIHAGTISRVAMEGYLQKEVRSLLTHVDSATMLDLLTKYAYGPTKRLVFYKPFIEALETLVPPHGVQHEELTAPPSPTAEPLHPSHTVTHTVTHTGATEASFSALLPESHHAVSSGVQQGHADTHPFAQAHGEGPHSPTRTAPPHSQVSAMEAPEEPQAYPYPASPRAAAGARPASSVAAPPEPISYLHYAQKQLSPRSRMEYDLFNRIHFDRLHQARGPGYQRAVTPKVGEEPLNVVEYRAVRQAYPEPQDVKPFLISPRGAHPGIPLPPSPASAPLPVKPPHAPPGPPTAVTVPAVMSDHTPAPQNPPPALNLPQHVYTPRSAGYRPKSQVFQLLQDPPVGAVRRTSVHSPTDNTHDPHAALVSPQRSPPTPISYYDIQKADGAEKGRLKAELASELQQGWKRQIQERQEFEKALEKAEDRWPFGFTHMPNDKRPPSAIVRPPSSPRRVAASGRGGSGY